MLMMTPGAVVDPWQTTVITLGVVVESWQMVQWEEETGGQRHYRER